MSELNRTRCYLTNPKTPFVAIYEDMGFFTQKGEPQTITKRYKLSSVPTYVTMAKNGICTAEEEPFTIYMPIKIQNNNQRTLLMDWYTTNNDEISVFAKLNGDEIIVDYYARLRVGSGIWRPSIIVNMSATGYF